MITKVYDKGYLAGRALVQQRGRIGGRRNVFVKLRGEVSNDLVFPTFGGQIKNPFKGAAKMFAGDLAEYRTNDKGVSPEIYILKTYEVLAVSEKVVSIKRDGYEHIPFAGDILIEAPETIGGSGTAMTVASVAATTATISGKSMDIWEVTMTATAPTTLVAGAILVESDASGDMLVKAINAVLPCDYDFMYNNATGATNDFDKTRYFITPALGGRMYTHLMSPIPACVKKLNKSDVNGWFKIGETR